MKPQTERIMRWTVGALGIALAVVGCSAGDTAPDSRVPASISLSPRIAASAAAGATTFNVTDDVGGKPAVVWSVNGVRGGSAEVGVVSAGVYTAPQTIPDGDSVVVSAESVADPSIRAVSTVLFVADRTSKDYYVPIPRVVDATHPAPTRILVVPPTTVATVTFLPRTGPAIPLTPIGNGALTFVLDATTATDRYVTGTLHNFVGRLDYRTASGDQVKITNLTVNVRDAGMPDVPIKPLGPTSQRSAYILNLRVDSATVSPYPALIGRTTELLGDHFDFIAVVATVTSNNNRFYTGVRNDVRGIGEPIFDNGAAWGAVAARRLRGITAFPIDGFFDGADGGFIHEIGHAWINQATDAVLGFGRPHWPMSTMALGVMGFSLANGEGGMFPFALTPLGDGTVRVSRATPTQTFTPLDLYLIGLVGANEVLPVQVLPQSATFSNLTGGLVLPATTYTIDDYIAAMGARVPSSATAQRDFTLACVILSYGRLMTASEMAFFDAACARAETRTPLTTLAGLVTQTAPGFFVATGGRATLTTRLP